MKVERIHRIVAEKPRNFFTNARCGALPPDTLAAACETVENTGVACLLEVTGGQPTPLGGWQKRGVDILISCIVLILLAPIMLMISLIIYLTMGRPIIFSHERIGFNGVPFRCYKFRTMVNDADDRLTAYLANNGPAIAEWKSTQKLRNDPRVTRFGLLLRKSSLDELPQFINTLRGDMTCVGPRPVTAAELRRYGTSARYYKKARPGISGLWQVSGRSNTSYRYRIALDRMYVTSWSVWLDVVILLKTVPAVLRLKDSA